MTCEIWGKQQSRLRGRYGDKGEVKADGKTARRLGLRDPTLVVVVRHLGSSSRLQPVVARSIQPIRAT
jgi:hypothetical protein